MHAAREGQLIQFLHAWEKYYGLDDVNANSSMHAVFIQLHCLLIMIVLCACCPSTCGECIVALAISS